MAKTLSFICDNPGCLQNETHDGPCENRNIDKREQEWWMVTVTPDNSVEVLTWDPQLEDEEGYKHACSSVCAQELFVEVFTEYAKRTRPTS